MKHAAWLWLWFYVGMVLYMAKRAYYLVTGPNPIATSYKQFVQRCWLPLLIRGGLESGVFWLCFNAQLLSKGLDYIGRPNYSWAVMMVTQFAPMAFFFGHAIDSFADFGVSKIPFVKDVLPQMPGPLPPGPAAPPAPANAKP